MRKFFLCVITIFLSFSFFIEVCDAKMIEVENKFANNVIINYQSGSSTAVSCNGMFTSDALDLISDILNMIRIAAPIALILFIAIDFAAAVISQDEHMLKKASSKVLKRALATAALFFIPTLIRLVLNLDGVREAIQIPDDPLCGTMTSVINIDDLEIE